VVRLREVILLAALALLVLGVVMVSSASMNVSPVALDGGGPATAVAADGVTLSSILTGRPVIYMAIAALAFTLGALLPVQRLAAILDEAPTPTPGGTLIGLVATAFAFTAVLVLVYVPGLGREVNFSHRWIAVPGAGSLQPSEVVKWAMLIALAVYAAAIRERITMFGLGLMPALAMLGFVSALVAVEDLGTGVLIAASGTLVLIAAGARLWQIGLLAPFGLAGVYGSSRAAPTAPRGSPRSSTRSLIRRATGTT
jgi:cell division protein FtsW